MKRIIVWITVLTLIVTGVFAMNACGKRTDKDGISYQLNVSNFDGITTYGEPMDLSRITITRTENGVSTEVPVEASMVTSRVDTSKPGAHILKFNYSGQSFNLPVIVKYKLQFLVDGDVYQSIHVLNRAELGEVAHPEKPGYNFVGWSTEIPGVIADNMTFHAVYEPIIPTLSEIQATYGDNLAAINLPYSVIGQWKFDAPEGTVGNVGKHTFPVSFVEYATGAVLATDTLTVNVAKKTVVFSDVVESFVYNGAVQKPTFKTDVVPQEDEKFEIIFFETPGANYTDVGTYDYYFEVDADNYEGTLVGTYEIKRAAITVKINSYEMVAGDAYPTVEYQLLGIGDADAETVARLIGLSVTQPEDIVAGAGVYTLTATASNPNVILNVQEGTLTVQSTVLDVADPIFEKEFAIYEDILADVLFKDNQNGNGTWSWKYPDALVGNVGIQEHIAVFTPYNTDKYDIIERTVQVKVEKKELIIEIVGKKEFDYNGQEHTLSYIIKDANGKQYASFTVLENPAYTNAGEYSITLKFEHQSYEASDVTEKLTIKKINPDTVFGKVDLTAVWNPNLTLAQITLPTSAMGQYTWVVEGNQTPGDIALSAGSKSYTAVFTPYDAYKTNYNSVSGEFTLQIEQATAKIEGVKDHYNFTYNKNAFVLEGITTNHTVSELAVEYKLNGQKVDSILNAGEYVVTFTLPETTNYKEAVVTATVTVAKADAGKPTVGTAAFGDLLLNAVKFPENSEGNWTILLDAGTNADENTKVGSVGEHKFVAVFTPTTENYKRSEVEITVNVAKKKIDVPQISGANKAQVYTGALLNSGLISGEGYTVEDIGGTAVGTYKAKVVLDTTSYEWNDPNVQSTFDAEYRITPATNAWTAQPAINSWVYGQAGNNGTASAMLGDVTIEYKLASAADTAYTTARPTNAGAYIARFTVVYANYFDLVQTCAFTIEKQTVNAPEYTKNYIYNGSPITVDIPTSTLYNIANHINTDVREGGYLASLTLTDSANYQWCNSESATITLAYTIGKANIVISNFSIVGWTYGQTANAPTYDVTFKDYTEVTYEYFDKDYNSIGATAPRNAGTYYVKATAAGNTNLNGYTTDFAQFTIAKASVSIDGVNDSYTETYNGVAFTITGVKASNGATVTKVITKKGVEGTVDTIIGVGEYTITYTVAEGPNYLGTERTVKVTIQQADVTISKPVIDGWTYGDGAKTPTANFNETFAYGQISFKYFTDADCKNEITDLTNAGTYYVKAVFAGNDDLKKAESEATAFVVAQKAVTVPTVSNKPYNGQNQTAGLTAAEGYTVVDNGGINVGSYKAVVTLVSDNYVWADSTSAAKELVYNITSIDNAQEFEKTSYTATYGDLLKDIVKLPANVQGTWSIEGATEATTVGNAGTRTFKAIFTPDEAGNYNERTVEITIVVAKKTVEKPIINPKEYTGEHLYSGLTTNALYSVLDNGGVDHGEYDVVLTLVDPNNYKWEDTEDASITLKFVISTAVNAWVEGKLPTISSWEYESEGDHAGKATAMHGGVLVEYKLADAPDSAYSTELPELPGNYIARFTTTDDNYTILTETKTFSITKRVITPPKQTQSSFVYSGSLIKSDLSDGIGYAVIADEGRTDVGSFTATISLTSEYYVWNDGTTEDKTFTYSITPATNTEEITLTYTATYGDLLKDIITLPTGIQGTWSIEGATDATVVGNAGTQSFKAIFTPDEVGNYNRREETITITVGKKAVNAPTEYTKEYTYTGSDITVVIPVESGLYTVSDNVAKNFGSYNATLTLTDSANYKWATTDAATTTVPYSIGKADVAVSITINGWTYGQAANAPVVSISKEFVGDVPYIVEYSEDGIAWSTSVPTDAGSYTVRVTVEENANYQVTAESVTEATFTIAKISTSITANEIYTFTYNGSAYTTQALNIPVPYTGAPALKYTYEDGSAFTGVTNAGEYKVVITLAETDTHKGATVTVTVKIDKANVTVSTPSIEGWTYNQTAKNPSAIVTYKDVNGNDITFEATLSFVYANSIDGEYNATVPTDAGIYYVKAVFAGNDNLNGAESEAQSFTIAKIVVPVPSIANKDYNGQVQYSGLVSDLYTVTEAENPLNKGEYTVTLTLNAPANYAWTSVDNTSATATSTYSILPVENTISVNIGNNAQWQYGTAEDVVNGYITVDVKYGGWTVVYRALGSTGDYTEGLPTKKGSYELKFTTTDPNCSIVSATRSVEILATSVAVPSIGNLTYNTTLQKPTVPAGLYTVVVNNGGTNVGEYTVTLKLLDTDSSYWGEDVTDVADKTITYQITKATVTLSDLVISNWNYNETASTPTVQINLSVPYYFEYFADGAWSKTAPTKAGSYKVRAVVDKTDNYDAVTTDGVAFTINQVTPTWSAPTFTGGKNGKYYLNQFVYPAANTLTATHANAADAANRTVPGTFNWGAPTFVANGGGYIELTFKPTDTVNYKTVTVKYDVNFVTVAVIGSTQYGSIESALAAAVSGNTVRVKIHDADLGPIYIKENVEVKSGITLLLPYGNGENDKNTYSNNIPQYTLHSGGCSSGKHGLSEGLATEAQCTLKVVVAEGVVITNRGTIEIAGLLSGGGSPHPYAGHTGGTHARLLLDAGARIENYGVIRAAGYIRELNKDNGSQVNVYSGATLYQPFVIMDYINGQYMAGAYKTMMNDAPDPVNAFNRFALTNVSPKVKVEYGGSIITWTALYTSTMESLDASKANNITSVTCVGTGGLLELSAGAYLEAKLDPDTLVTKLDIYGGAKTNSMEISVSFAEALGANVGFSFSTADCWFPLTYLFDIDLHSGTYTIGQDFKLMPGAKLTVATDAELIVNAKLIVYDQGTISSPSEEDGKFTDGRNGLVADGFLYPTTVAAVFTVNGKATIQELGGEVHSQTPGATVTITQGTYLEGNEAATYELGTLDGVVADMYVSIMEKVAGTDKLSQDVATRFIVKKNAVLINNDGSFVNPSLTTTYAYANGIWRQPVVHINFNVNGGNGVGSIGIPLDDGIYQSLPTPTRKHYTFVGWKDANGNLIANGTALPTGCVAGDTLSLTAEWIPTQYTIKYQGIDKDGNPIAWTMNDGVFTVVDSSFSLPTITPPTGYSHTGWKFNGKNIIALTIEECLAAVDAESRTITVQVVFETSDSIYTYNFNLGTAYIGLAYPTQNWSLGTYPNSTDHPELMKQITSDSNGVNYKTSTEKEFYFEGWYTDAGFTRAYTENYEPTDEEKASKTITLYAKWTQKFKVICKNGDVVEGEYYVDPSNAVYPTLPTPTLTGYTFAGWYYGETPVATGRFVESTEAHTLTAEWTLNSYTITVTKLSNATIKVNGTSVALNGTVSVPYGSEVTVTVTFSKSTKSMNIKDANKKSLVSTSNAGDHKFTMPASNVTIEAESSDGCFTPDTLITLANGTQKRVDELTAGDKILAWDFFTGTYVAKDISLLVNHGEDLYRIANLVFSDGTTLRIIAEHGVFDYDLNKYVYFSVDNMEEYIGHRFVQYAADGTYNIVTLVDAYETEEYTSAWSVSSAITSNAFASGLLTVAPPEDFYNWIEMDGKLMYNVEQFQQDVATYGLYTYEDFKDYVTYDQFIEWNGAYLKVAVEKGYFTFEYILELIELYKGWMPNN